MRDLNVWTMSCGWWGAVRVRAHVSLLVVAVLAVYLTGRTSTTEDPWLSVVHGLMWVGILSASVVLHELGHSLAAWRLGGGVDLIVLGPLGGMQLPNVPHESHREVIVALAGPLVNLVLAMAAGTALMVSGARVYDLFLQPLYPSGLLDGASGLVALRMAFWINWLLLLVNLLPAAPLDGGRALRSVLWPVTGYRVAVRVVSRSGMVIACGLCLLAWWVYHPRDYRLVPAWTPLVLMAIYLFFSARQETKRMEEQDEDDELFGYDFSEGYTSLERTPRVPRWGRAGAFRRWLRDRRELKQRRLRQIERDEERRVDSILVRVKELGIDAISPEERALLQRVSARYRNRLES